jgi:predicted mannosyl-3-phosphoglycerate phosphatase (HAD superfamily)
MMMKSGIKNMSEGESYNDVTLIKIMGDSVLVNYQKEQKVILKSGKKHSSSK